MAVTEKRRARRVRAERAASVTLRKANVAVEVKARTRDISSNGAFFYLDRQLSPGSSIEMVVMLPDELAQGSRSWVCCRGKVVRVEQPSTNSTLFGIAAEFDHCSVLPEL